MQKRQLYRFRRYRKASGTSMEAPDISTKAPDGKIEALFISF